MVAGFENAGRVNNWFLLWWNWSLGLFAIGKRCAEDVWVRQVLEGKYLHLMGKLLLCNPLWFIFL